MQKLPDFYKGRVAELKQRTMELQEIAYNYTSGDKNGFNDTHWAPPREQAKDGHKQVSFTECDQEMVVVQQNSPQGHSSRPVSSRRDG